MPIPWEHFSAGSLRDQAQAIPKSMPTTKAMLLFAASVVEKQEKDERTCEWNWHATGSVEALDKRHSENRHVETGEWRSACGRATSLLTSLDGRPCWCGGTVVSK